MISFASALPYKVTQPYENLLQELEDLGTLSNCGPAKVVGKFEKNKTPGEFTFDCHFHLQRWHERGSSSKEFIHIVVHVQETIKKEGEIYNLTRSTVTVSYFKIIDSQARLLHTVHFDHGAPDKSHPIFHAQLTREQIALTPENASELEFELEREPCQEPFKNARIPTCDMTLPSVVLCLAADHTNTDYFAEFLKRIEIIQKDMPHPSFAKTRTSLQSQSSDLRSSHWFAHMLQE